MIYVGPYWKEVVAAVILSLIITASSISLPYLIKMAVDRYITKEELETAARLAGVGKIAGYFIGLMALGFLANFFQVVLLEWTGQRIMHRMRQDLFSHMIDLEIGFFNRNPVGKLVTRLTNDIQNMHEMFTSVIVTLFNDLVRIGGILIILFFLNWRLALILSLLLPIMAGQTVWFSRLARLVFRDIRTHLARINSYLQESLSGLSLIQLFSKEKVTRDNFRDLNQLYYRNTMRQIHIFGIFMPLVEVMSSVAIGIIIWFGGGQIISQAMTIGTLVAFLSYMRLFFQPLRELSQKYSIVQSAMASAERIFQLLDTEKTLTSPAAPYTPDTVKGKITFDNISFGYEKDQDVIKKFTVSVEPAETLAIVGATGSGKSTLINLLERFYDPDAGRVLIDDVDIRKYDPHLLRNHIGLVMQDVFMVSASVRENILLDRNLDEAGLERIIVDAQLDRIVANLPQGVETRLGEGGIDLSAGQKQLLAFARVLARDPRILVLDEATANVDSETEILIEKAIAKTLSKRTSIVIAHRLSTIRRADRILVMDQGEIMEQGTHEALMERMGLYYQLQRLDHGPCEPLPE